MPTIELEPLSKSNTEQTLLHRQAAAPRRTTRRAIDVPRKIGTKVLCRVIRQLSTLLHAGMPLVPALSALHEQLQCPARGRHRSVKTANAPIAQIIERVRDDVNEGGSLAEALGHHRCLFSPFVINMVAAGEKSGALETVLARLADVLEKRTRLLGKVKSAVAYPVMMAVVAVGVVVFLLSYVVPSISKLFMEMNQELPWPTRLLMAMSGATRAHLIGLFALACLIAFGIYMLSRTREGKRWMDRMKLALPLFGPLVLKLEVARLTRTLSTCLQSGIPVIAALEITQRVVQNQMMADAVNTTRERVHKGETIANAIRSTGMFPPVVFHLIATGQMTGSIEEALMNIAEMYEAEVETAVRTLTSLLEPLILLVMGAVVGFIVLAVLLPIFEINQAL